MNQLSLFCYTQRPWLKRLALEALRQPTEIEFDKESLRIYPVRNGIGGSLQNLPRYRVKSLTWLTDFHQLVDAMAAHRCDNHRAEGVIRARFNSALAELQDKFETNEALYDEGIQSMLDDVELLSLPNEYPPPWEVEDDPNEIPF